MDNFTPVPAQIGGALIGLAAASLLLFHGKIAGISGIVGGITNPEKSDRAWRVAFVVGLLLGGLALGIVYPVALPSTFDGSLVYLAVAGLFVGVGTRMANGCTSGHGVCGIGRFSPRSVIATLTFMATGAATVYVLRLTGVIR